MFVSIVVSTIFYHQNSNISINPKSSIHPIIYLLNETPIISANTYSRKYFAFQLHKVLRWTIPCETSAIWKICLKTMTSLHSQKKTNTVVIAFRELERKQRFKTKSFKYKVFAFECAYKMAILPDSWIRTSHQVVQINRFNIFGITLLIQIIFLKNFNEL